MHAPPPWRQASKAHGCSELPQVGVATATRRLAGKRLAVLAGTRTTWRSMESHTVGFAVFGENETLGLQVLLQQCRLGFANCRRCFGELLHAGSIEARRCRLCVHHLRPKGVCSCAISSTVTSRRRQSDAAEAGDTALNALVSVASQASWELRTPLPLGNPASSAAM